AELLAAGEGNEPLALLFLRAVAEDRIAVERVVDAHDHARGGAAAADLLHGEGVRDVVRPCTAPLLRDGHAHQPELAELANGLHGKVVLLVPAPGVGN